jgi:predicted transcriptional regulator
MASLAAVLSEDNRALLRVIRDANPRSLTELAELTGRKLPNLSRTLRTMASYGLVALEKDKGEVRPTVMATQFTVIGCRSRTDIRNAL